MAGGCIPCGQRRVARDNAKPDPSRRQGTVASAESFTAQPRYLVVPRQTSTTGKRFTTLVAAQDYARRTSGIIRQL